MSDPVLEVFQYLRSKLKGKKKLLVAIDVSTNNIVITNGQLGFVVTHVCAEQWKMEDILKDVKDRIGQLRRGYFKCIEDIVNDGTR